MDSMRNTQRTSPMSVLEGKQTSGAGIDFTDDFVDMTAACMLPSNNKTHQLVMKVRRQVMHKCHLRRRSVRRCRDSHTRRGRKPHRGRRYCTRCRKMSIASEKIAAMCGGLM